MRLADRVIDLPESGIREFFELAEARDDVISLGVGEPDFSAPWAARMAAIDSLERGRTSYTSNRGLRELRERIAEHHRHQYDQVYDPDEAVLVTTGASEAVDLAFRALVDPGDVVAVHDPTYISYGPGIELAGGEPLSVPTRAADDFALTRERLEAAGAERADALVLCYPNNPTGAVMTESQLAEVAGFCREHDVRVIADEIYSALTYEGEHASIATQPGMRERTIVINGFSKAYAMTGLRLGYAMGPAETIDAMNRIHQYTMLSAPTTAQYAAIEALRSCADDVEEMVEEYDRRRRFVHSRFREMGLDCFEPRGAFYAFPDCGGDDEAFAAELLEAEGVAVVPGSVFGEGGRGHLRVSYATSMRELKRATERIESFLATEWSVTA
ncbi:pyridoxal phosphate-dependent aminotransferase [Halopenitus salinus]|uniref:Aminotransferase n=1 Tax=Halopenitus salinus TaxID=1198295 RepID=A0ABD5UXQ7_9EURY